MHRNGPPPFRDFRKTGFAMTSLIERAAERLHWEITNEGRSIDMAEAKAIVRIVLTAIRDPSEGMKRAGAFCEPFMTEPGARPMTPGQIIACACYDAMIDAALGEG